MSSLFRNRYRRESVRRKGYDYSLPGSYYFTLCTENRKHLFGQIIASSCENKNQSTSQRMVMNEAGKIVTDCWYDLPNHYKYITLDEFVVMPDHVHGIIVINNPIDDVKYHGLPELIRALKSFSSRRISETGITNKTHIWQHDYYDRIINGHEELEKIRNYIKKNPENWGRNINKPIL